VRGKKGKREKEKSRKGKGRIGGNVCYPA